VKLGKLRLNVGKKRQCQLRRNRINHHMLRSCVSHFTMSQMYSADRQELEGHSYVSMKYMGAVLISDGDQNFFPVYEPDADALRKKWREAEEEARAHHYDSTKEGECTTQIRLLQYIVIELEQMLILSSRERSWSIPILPR